MGFLQDQVGRKLSAAAQLSATLAKHPALITKAKQDAWAVNPGLALELYGASATPEDLQIINEPMVILTSGPGNEPSISWVCRFALDAPYSQDSVQVEYSEEQIREICGEDVFIFEDIEDAADDDYTEE